MIQIREIKNATEVSDFVYKMSIENSTASYKRMFTYEEVFHELQRRIEDGNSNVCAVYYNEVLVGVFSYYWIDNDKYIQTTIFVFENCVKDCFKIVIDRIKEGRKDYRLLIGIPGENIYLKTELSILGKEIEHSVNMIYRDAQLEYKHNEHIIEINKDNYDMYREFHNRYAIKNDMYWTAELVYRNINQFLICCYIDNSEIIGSIFLKKGDYDQEIFGLFADTKNQVMYRELLSSTINYVNTHSKKVNIVYFIDTESQLELDVAMKLGFTTQDSYLCYEIKG